jgi:DnaJ homolog subfamily C member 11
VPITQIQATLKLSKWSNAQRKLEKFIRPRGDLTCSIDASSLSNDSVDRTDDSLVEKIAGRINAVQISKFAIRHRIKVRLLHDIHSYQPCCSLPIYKDGH